MRVFLQVIYTVNGISSDLIVNGISIGRSILKCTIKFDDLYTLFNAITIHGDLPYNTKQSIANLTWIALTT